MSNGRNEEIKAVMKENGFYQWQVAEKLGIADSTLVRWLRADLSDERKRKILDAISELASC